MIDLRALAALAEQHADDLGRPVAPFLVGDAVLDTDVRPALMGIINLSRDSWYRESIAATTAAAVRRGRVLVAQGADLVDIGAESVVGTAARVEAAEQTKALVPVIEELSTEDVAVSVESYHPSTLEAALTAGARVVNLTGSVDDDTVFDLAAAFDASVVLCHVDGDHARDLSRTTAPTDPIPEMLEQFTVRLENARTRGVRSVAVDPGVGFSYGWTTDYTERARYQSVVLLNTFRLRRLGAPICQALPSAADVFGEEVRSGEGFFAVLAALGGTGIFRTHEVPRVAAVLEVMRDLPVG